ncbi:MAG TPA: DUF2461 domain-containing protein [Chloroflexota bacterium]
MFEGFPPAGLEFLRGLAANNNKAWFEAHRDDYEECLLEPAKDLVVDLGQKLQDQISPNIQADPRFNGSIMRISRDIRFSKDKSPYKSWFGLWFWEGGPRRSMESPGFYFSLDPDQLVLGAGKHGFDKPMLDKYRSAAVDPKTGPGLLKVVEGARAAGYDVGGKSYKQTPRGYEPKDPATADMLLYGALHAGISMPVPPEAHSPHFVDFCLDRFRAVAPLEQWLGKVFVG